MNSKSSQNKYAVSFPPAWLWLVDEMIPTWVKGQYSPKDTWKNKPFSKEDARFFFKGIDELSQLFTEERPKGMPPYFQHPKYRSSYLLYFLPLQMAKFLTLFQLHPKAIEAALNHEVLRVADIGAGPGTASFSLLLYLLALKLPPGKELPPIELYWFDTNKEIMADGVALVEQMASQFPKLRGKIKIHTAALPWWKSAHALKEKMSLTILGHVLNEANAPNREFNPFWQELLEKAHGGGILMIEPATRKSAQTLANLRNGFFESEWIKKTPQRIWGPCLHAGICPLSEGRDWCHFSYPASIPGKWFKNFSEALSSERHWVKFTYLWLASESCPAPKPSANLRRVISDPLSESKLPSVLICEPETPGRFTVSPKSKIHRGDLVRK